MYNVGHIIVQQIVYHTTSIAMVSMIFLIN